MTNARRRSLLISFVVVLTVALPTSIVGAAGQRNLEGVLRVAHGENFATNQEYWDYHLQTAQGTYRLEFGGEGPAEFRNGAHVRVQGTPDARGVVALNASASTNQVLAVAAAPTSSAKKLALVLVNFVTHRYRVIYAPALVSASEVQDVSGPAVYRPARRCKHGSCRPMRVRG